MKKEKSKKRFNPHIFKYFRLCFGWTQGEAATELGTVRKTIANWESARTEPARGKNTKTTNVHEIAEKFETEADVFFIRMLNFGNC